MTTMTTTTIMMMGLIMTVKKLTLAFVYEPFFDHLMSITMTYVIVYH